MSIKRIQNEVAASRFTLPVVCFVSALVWFTLSAETTTTGAECSRYWNCLSKHFASNWMLGNAFMLMLNYLCVYLIMELNNRYNIIRTRTHMASAVFCIARILQRFSAFCSALRSCRRITSAVLSLSVSDIPAIQCRGMDF